MKSESVPPLEKGDSNKTYCKRFLKKLNELMPGGWGGGRLGNQKWIQNKKEHRRSKQGTGVMPRIL